MQLTLSDKLEARIQELLMSPEKLSHRAFLGVNAALDAAVKLQRVRRLEQEVQRHEAIQMRLRLKLYELCGQLYACEGATARWDRLDFSNDVLAFGMTVGALQIQHSTGGLQVMLAKPPSMILNG
jgi:hypothetical protein